RRVLERRAHIGQDHQLRATQPAAALDRTDRAGAAVGRRTAADAEVDDLRASLHSGENQLAGAGRAGGPGVTLGLTDQPEPARGGRLDDRLGAGDGEPCLELTT